MLTRTARQSRILFVDHSSSLDEAGRSLLDIALGFRGRGAVALFEDGPLAAALVSHNVAVIPVYAGSMLQRFARTSSARGLPALLGALRGAFELARVARAFGVLYANSPSAFLASAAAGFFARRPVAWHLRQLLDDGRTSAWTVRILVAVANARASLVVVSSQAIAAAFIAAGGRQALVRVVHDAVDSAQFDRIGAGARTEMRARLGIDERAYVVGTFTHLHPLNGQDVLLDALEMVPEVHALVVGSACSGADSAYLRSLHDRASRPSLAPRVHLLGEHDEIPRLIVACDAIVHVPLMPERGGRPLVQALLGRRPLIASDVGGAGDFVEDGITAVLVPPGDAVRLAAAINDLRGHPVRSDELAFAGAADARRRFSHEAMIAGVTRAMDETLGANAPPLA